MTYRFRCEECKEPLVGECWYRRTCANKPLEPYEPKIEYYCNKCARAQMDEHNTNGLTLIIIKPDDLFRRY